MLLWLKLCQYLHKKLQFLWLNHYSLKWISHLNIKYCTMHSIMIKFDQLLWTLSTFCYHHWCNIVGMGKKMLRQYHKNNHVSQINRFRGFTAVLSTCARVYIWGKFLKDLRCILKAKWCWLLFRIKSSPELNNELCLFCNTWIQICMKPCPCYVFLQRRSS